MDRLLLRSKSHKQKATRREQPLDFDFTPSPQNDSEPTYPWKTRNVMAMRAASAAGQWGEISDVQQRPKTSNATSPLVKMMPPAGDPIVITADNETFLFPTPTPRRGNFSPATPLSGVRSEPEDFGIGVALGSPSQVQQFQGASIAIGSPSQVPHFQSAAVVEPQPSISSNDMFSPAKSTPNEQRDMRNDMNEPGKPKLGRWRSLGSFFGKRGLQQRHDDHRLHQPEVVVEDFAHTTPAHYFPGSPFNSPKDEKKSKRKQKKSCERAATVPVFLSQAEVSPATPPKGPMLDISIPDIQMERYSVMFSSVLPNRQSNLLARRQGGKASNLEV